MIGSGVLVDSLAKTLAAHGLDVERTDSASATATADVLLPDLLVLAGDAAQSRGAAVVAKLRAAGGSTPTLVICAEELSGFVPQQGPAHIAYVTAQGGVSECARRVRTLLGALLEDQSSGSSLQQLADKLTGSSTAAKDSPQARTSAQAKVAGAKASGSTAVGDKGTAHQALEPRTAQAAPGMTPQTKNVAGSGTGTASDAVQQGKDAATRKGPGSRAATNQPASVQSETLSAVAPAKPANTQQLAAMPAAAKAAKSTSISPPSGPTDQPPLAAKSAASTSVSPARGRTGQPVALRAGAAAAVSVGARPRPLITTQEGIAPPSTSAQSEDAHTHPQPSAASPVDLELRVGSRAGSSALPRAYSPDGKPQPGKSTTVAASQAATRAAAAGVANTGTAADSARSAQITTPAEPARAVRTTDAQPSIKGAATGYPAAQPAPATKITTKKAVASAAAASSQRTTASAEPMPTTSPRIAPRTAKPPALKPSASAPQANALAAAAPVVLAPEPIPTTSPRIAPRTAKPPALKPGASAQQAKTLAAAAPVVLTDEPLPTTSPRIGPRTATPPALKPSVSAAQATAPGAAAPIAPATEAMPKTSPRIAPPATTPPARSPAAAQTIPTEPMPKTSPRIAPPATTPPARSPAGQTIPTELPKTSPRIALPATTPPALMPAAQATPTAAAAEPMARTSPRIAPPATTAPARSPAAAQAKPTAAATEPMPKTSPRIAPPATTPPALKPIAPASQAAEPTATTSPKHKPSDLKPATSALVADSAVDEVVQLRASELEIGIAISDPPPASAAARMRDLNISPARGAAPHPASVLRSGSLSKAAPEHAPEARSEVSARQALDSEVDVVLSDRPVSLAAQQLFSRPAPPSEAHGEIILTAGASNTQAQRFEPAALGAASQPSGANRAPASALDPATNPPEMSSAADARATTALRRPRNPLEPAARQPDAAQGGADSRHTVATKRPRNPLEPVAAAQYGGSDPRNPAVSKRPRNPLDPIEAAQPSSTDPRNPAAAKRPRNPLDPIEAAQPSSTDPRNPAAAKRPRNPLDPIEAAQDSDNAARNTAPRKRARDPLDASAAPQYNAASGGDDARVTTALKRPRRPVEQAASLAAASDESATRNTTTLRRRRSPLDPAAASEHNAAVSAGQRNPRTARRPHDPFAPAALRVGAGAPQDSAAVSDSEPRSAAAAQLSALERSQAWPDATLSPAMADAAKPRRRGIWVLGAIAAIGCSAFLVYRTYDGAAISAPGNPAAGSLEQTPALTASPEPLAVPPVPTPPPSPGAPGIETAESTAAAQAAERSAAAPRRTGAAQEPDLTTAAGRARALVDNGSEMLRQRRYGLAEGMYLKALQEVPEYPPAMADLVRVHLARRDGMEAMRWAERLVAKQNNALHQLLLGDAQALRGNIGAAQEAWTKAARGGNATARQRLEEDEEE